jgi:LCP family protein required for cell wall assembly
MEEKKTKEAWGFIKTTLVGFLTVLILSLVVIVTFGGLFLFRFSSSAKIKPQDVVNQAIKGARNPLSEKYLNLLILGLDKRENDDSLLTDTIMLAVFNVDTGDYLLFSLPRDLWIPDLQTKVNALYYYGQKIDPNDGTEMMASKIEEILDTKIDYTMVLEMNDIKNLVDILGGVKVDVERGFVDEEFPKDDGSNEVMTVKFRKGEQVFDGEKALQFMRSRKSTDEIEGTDQARQARQKKVILALKSKLINSKELIRSPGKLGDLYRFFREEVRTVPELGLKDMASFWQLAVNFRKGKSTEAEIPWKSEDENQILFSDYVYFNGAYLWVLTPKDENWNNIANFFQSQRP